MADCGCQFEAKNREQRRVLRILLALNGGMFLVGVVMGAIAHSTALIADSLDNFADAAIFGISLYAIGQSPRKKVQAAFLSGMFQATLAGLTVLHVVRRFSMGGVPESGVMIAIALLAVGMNLYCMKLMAAHRHEEVHLRASWIFLSNDVIANLGVVLAGVLVAVLHSPLPDLVLGLIIALLVLWGSIRILRDARRQVVT